MAHHIVNHMMQIVMTCTPLVHSVEGGTVQPKQSAFPTAGNLSWYVLQNDTTEIKRCLRNGADPNGPFPTDTPPITIAALNGNYDIVKLLGNAGADVNKVDRNGETALMASAAKGHITIVEYLLSKKADPNIRTKDGASAIFAAMNAGRGDIEIGEMLILHGAKLNGVQTGGYSPLMYATVLNSKDWTTLFISHGADISEKNENGDTAATLAAKGPMGLIFESIEPKKP